MYDIRVHTIIKSSSSSPTHHPVTSSPSAKVGCCMSFPAGAGMFNVVPVNAGGSYSILHQYFLLSRYRLGYLLLSSGSFCSDTSTAGTI